MTRANNSTGVAAILAQMRISAQQHLTVHCVTTGLASVVRHTVNIRDLDQAIAATEAQAGLAPGSIGILPVCETALGVVNVREIASASTRIRNALLGAEDLAADLMGEHRGSGPSCCPLCPRSGKDTAPPLGDRGAVCFNSAPAPTSRDVRDGFCTTPYA